MPRFIIGALASTIIGTVIVNADASLAINVLIGMTVVAAYLFYVTYLRRAADNWSPQAFSPAPVLGALVIGVTSVLGLQYLGVSLAWHPAGSIKKTVQNMTTNGPVADANDPSSAITAKPGDILNYTVTVSNTAAPAGNHYNDLAYTELSDQLPVGVQLVSDPVKTLMKEQIGTILPGKSVTKIYQVKVVATKNGTVITNKACFTANSVVKDNPQDGCDTAVVKVDVPVTPPTPTPPTTHPPTPTPTPPTPTPPTPTPTTPTPTPPTPTAPTPTPPPTPPSAATPPQLPNVGPRNILIIALYAGIGGYIVSALLSVVSSRSKSRPY